MFVSFIAILFIFYTSADLADGCGQFESIRPLWYDENDPACSSIRPFRLNF